MDRLFERALTASRANLWRFAILPQHRAAASNAPNFTVAAITNERGVTMPSFFGYMIWSCAVLLPVLANVSYVSVGG